MNQVDGTSDTLPLLWLCVGESSEKGQWPLPGLCSFVLEEAVPGTYPNVRRFIFSLYASDVLPAAAPVLEPRGSESV